MAQELKRDQPVRLPNPGAQPFVAALKTARFFAVLFFWITMVCVLAYAAAFVLTEWIGMYDPPAAEAVVVPSPAAPPAEAKPAAEPAKESAPASTSFLSLFEGTALAAQKPDATKPGAKESGGAKPLFELPPEVPRATGKETPKEPAKETPKETAKAPTPETPATTAPPKEPDSSGKVTGMPETPAPLPATMTPEEKREQYRHVTANVLKPLRVVGVLASFLLATTLWLYLQISLLGRLAGIKQLTNALFLMLLFLATVMPWDSIFDGFHVNAFYDFQKLLGEHMARVKGDPGDFWKQAQYFSRFLILPLVSAALLALSGVQFASGYSESVVANE